MKKVVKLDWELLAQVLLNYEAFSNKPPKSAKKKVPDSEKIRTHRKEFSQVAKTAAAVRGAFADIIAFVKDTTMFRRFSSQLVAVLKADVIHDPGERTVEAGDVTLLETFDFNEKALLRRSCKAPYTIEADRKKGMVTVDIPSFLTINTINKHKQSTHFKLLVAVCAIDFDGHQTTSFFSTSPAIKMDTVKTDTYKFEAKLAPNETRHLFVSIGIAFLKIEHGREYTINGGKLNAMQICKVYPKVTVEELKALSRKASNKKMLVNPTGKLQSEREMLEALRIRLGLPKFED
ncbi:hypothetical protein LX64_01736 [Chitinophaga skermanii]|uniref:Uncharacterized protein n=1 Tax=Chitinophaga skermanii TaxID=331697 RepID=A0A327QPV3_9BACT|nr:hypothetical protein [Chitinophaga skermanii]RAJ06609.1 hypothetical protein LX64_01736 [Chitinophaga skermanii]